MSSHALVRQMFAGGNTSVGFHSFYNYIIGHDAARVIVIKGGPGVGKSTLMKYVGENMLSRGYDVELFHCSSDPESLDGVVFPGIGVALIDGTAPHIVDPVFPGAVDEILYMGEYWDESAMRAARNQIVACTKDVSRLFQRAYRFLRTASDVLDDWSEANAEGLDHGAANKVADTVIGDIIGTANVADRPGAERHLFASAITPAGFVNHLETVVAACSRRYVVEGGPGSGKSRLITHAANRALECGFDVELFHCSLNPASLEHLIIPALGVAVITSVEPHQWTIGNDDTLVDMAQCLDPAVVERNEKIIEYDRKLMNEAMGRAIFFLNQAREMHDFLESFYVPNIDFDAVRALRHRTLERILRFAEETPRD
ncbi:MAG: PRK06851 family protein [Clostridia bacterium]|nr:PRK06851 family protein [Clostridia bacterium]